MPDKDSFQTPGQIIWSKLRRNRTAMFGLFIICLSFLMAIFGYTFIPDNSVDANRMNLPLSMKSPGFKVQMLKVKREAPIYDHNLGISIFKGFPDKYKYIPLEQHSIKDNELHYIEYTGIDNAAGVEQSILISEIDPDNDKLSAEELQSKYISYKTFILGTDRFGRDMFSRLILASRISLTVGFIAVFISLVVGITLGVIAGFYGGKIDDAIMWLINVVWSIPTLLLVIAITMALGKGMAQVFIAVGLTMWVEIARIVRGQVMTFRETEFVVAGKALGLSNFRLIFRHMLPNIVGPVIVIAAANFATAILLEAGLSFLGMGAQPPTPSWGMMIKENYGYIVVDAAYLAILPGIAIMMMVLSFTLLGNGLRDAFDVNKQV